MLALIPYPVWLSVVRVEPLYQRVSASILGTGLILSAATDCAPPDLAAGRSGDSGPPSRDDRAQVDRLNPSGIRAL